MKRRLIGAAVLSLMLATPDAAPGNAYNDFDRRNTFN